MTRVEFADQFGQLRTIGDEVIVVGENNDRRVTYIEKTVAAGGEPDVVLGLNDLVDHRGFSWAVCREALFGLAVVEHVNQRAIAAVVFVNTANERGTALRPMDRFDTKGDLVTHGRLYLLEFASNGIRVCEVPLSGTWNDCEGLDSQRIRRERV